jgi:hypothetical protein
MGLGRGSPPVTRSRERSPSRPPRPGPGHRRRRLGADGTRSRTPSVDSTSTPPRRSRAGSARDLVRSRASPRTAFTRFGSSTSSREGGYRSGPSRLPLPRPSRGASRRTRTVRLVDVCNQPWARAPVASSDSRAHTRLAPLHGDGAEDETPVTAAGPHAFTRGPPSSPCALDGAEGASAFPQRRGPGRAFRLVSPGSPRERGPNDRGVVDRVSIR